MSTKGIKVDIIYSQRRIGFLQHNLKMVALAHAIFPKKVSISTVWVTVKISLFGILFSIIVQTFEVPPFLLPYVQEIQGLIILICMGNLLAYLLVDLYLEFRMKGEVPRS